MRGNLVRRLRAGALAVALATLVAAGDASAGRVKLLYDFAGDNQPGPFGTLVRDAGGNLYGTTKTGDGSGTVFKLAPDGTETTLWSLPDYSDPTAGLVADGKGHLYGTTDYAGDEGACDYYYPGCGTVFSITESGRDHALYDFEGGSDGGEPLGRLLLDAKGDLYGTTYYGGGTGCSYYGCGTVFRVAPDGTETVLYSFSLQQGGFHPAAGVISDRKGNLYGTTISGGKYNNGVVYRLSPKGKETVLHSFKAGRDGSEPVAALIFDSAGDLYGTTEIGGGKGCGGLGCGTVFRLAPDGTETVLYAFKGGKDGSAPMAELIEDGAGNLYGTTETGGQSRLCQGGPGCGTVFRIASDGTETVLARLNPGVGTKPYAGLVMDASGNLYGAASSGGGFDNSGSIFEVTP